MDQLLNGGLLSGNIYDVCGTYASGKTQLHTKIVINWAINHDFETLVVDTKGDFSGERINRILLNRGAEYDDSMPSAFFKITMTYNCISKVLLKYIKHYYQLFWLCIYQKLCSYYSKYFIKKNTNKIYEPSISCVYFWKS